MTTWRGHGPAWKTSPREALDPADEVRAFAQLRDTGATTADIARTFGVTEQHVYRRMALANLPTEVLDALKARDISLSTAAVFTVATDRDLALQVLDRIRGTDTSTQQVRRMLLPDAIGASDSRVRFVGVEAYEAAGGALTRDLFSDNVALHDEELLNQLYNDKLQADAQELGKDWKWFEVLDSSYASYERTSNMQRVYKVEGQLSEEECDLYDELTELAETEVLNDAGQKKLAELQDKMEGDYTDEQRQVAGLLVYVHNGKLSISGPWIKKEDQKAAVENGALTGYAARLVEEQAQKAEAPAPRYSGSLVKDLQTLQLHAVQAALARNLELQLDLLAFQLSKESLSSIYDITPREATIVPERADGLTPDPILDVEANRGHWQESEEQASAFAEFRAKGKQHRDHILAVRLARVLPHYRNHLFADVAELARADIRAIWTPTKADFFGRIKSDQLDELMMELTGLPRDDKRIETFVAQKKSGKAEGLEALFTDEKVQDLWGLDDAAKERLAKWVPDCL